MGKSLSKQKVREAYYGGGTKSVPRVFSRKLVKRDARSFYSPIYDHYR